MITLGNATTDQKRAEGGCDGPPVRTQEGNGVGKKTEARFPKVLLVTDGDPAYTPSAQHLQRTLMDRGVPVEEVPAKSLPQRLQSFQANTKHTGQDAQAASNPNNGLLLLGERILGPLGDPAPFLESLVGGNSVALAPADVGTDPVATTIPLLYVTPRDESLPSLASLSFSPSTEPPDSNKMIAACQKELEAAGKLSFLLLPEATPDGDTYFLRDTQVFTPSCPFLPWSVFTKNPLTLERWAIPTAPLASKLLTDFYPPTAFWKTLLEAAPPSTWSYTTGQYRVLPGTADPNAGPAPKTQVAISLTAKENLSQLLKAAANVPGLDRVTVISTEDLSGTELAANPVTAPLTFKTAPAEQVRNGTAALRNDPGPSAFFLFLSDSDAATDRGVAGASPLEQVLTNLTASPEHVAELLLRLGEAPMGLAISPRPIGMGAPPKSALYPMLPWCGMLWLTRDALATVQHVLKTESNSAQSALSSLEVAEAISGSLFEAGLYACSFQTLESAARQSLIGAYRLDSLTRHLPAYAVEGVPLLRARLEEASLP